jgi:hypothetical protein
MVLVKYFSIGTIMAKVALTRSRYKNGYFVPTNPEKYVGDVSNIIYRSSWEKIVCGWFDTNSSIVCWNSESLIIPYFSTLDNKMHKYHVDFMAKIKDRDGVMKTYVLEIKPEKEMLMPTTRVKKRLLLEMETYTRNQCKWAAAKIYCESRGCTFLVLNEYDIGIKKRVNK